MNDERRECPRSEVLAAFIKGSLSKDEQALPSDHVLECLTCRRTVLKEARFHRGDGVPRLPSSRRPSPWWVAAAAAAFAGVVYLGAVRVWNDPIRPLVAAAPTGSRRLEPRLTGGFAWAPMAPVLRGRDESIEPEQMRLIGAAGEVLRRTADDRSIDGKHAAAIAHLLAGRPTDASRLLNDLAGSAKNPRLWSDLAAALFAASVSRGDPAQLARALAAADTALRIEPKMPEALFNRALIVERLGLRDEARAAWESYLAVDAGGGWAREARQHHARLLEQGTDRRDIRAEFHAVAQAAALKRDWPASISYLGMELDQLTDDGDELARIEALLMRARIRVRAGESGAAAEDLARAARSINAIADRSMRDHAEADRLAVEGALASPPAKAVSLLTRAIDLHGSMGRCEQLPEMYLRRGRALAAMRKVENAAADFDAGIRESEPQRDHWETVLAREELFEEALGLAVSRGDFTRALAYAERKPASELESFRKAVTSAPPSVVTIEFAWLPSRLVVFVVADFRIDAVQTEVERAVLSAEIDRLTNGAMSKNDPQFRRAASALYDRLLAPVASRIAAGDTLVFVPDGTLSGVPFSALLGPDGRYVVEDHAVLIAPSAVASASYGIRPTLRADARDVLLIGGPPPKGTELASVQREVDAIAALYGSRAERALNGIAPSAFERRAAGATILHFAGHAAARQDGGGVALVTSRVGDKEELLDARDIAAMDLRHTRLVVLSACSTGLDRETDGPRALSVARAFLSAGVSSVAATLWPIEDAASAEFFLRFHRNLTKGDSPVDALRATQLEWIRRDDTSPMMWAAVQVIGS